MAVLEMRGIRKRFGAALALDDVDLTVRGGEVHALLGENGAGKSTLMRVLLGLERLDGGEIRLDGAGVAIANPTVSARLGIGMVHQHDAVIGALSVAENLELSRPARGLRLDRARLRQRALDAAQRAGVTLPDPDRLAGSLGVGERQRIDFVRALDSGGRFLILDEPTAALTPDEADALLRTVRGVVDRGVGVVFITHRLAEVEEIADRVSVLRHGRVVGQAGRAELQRDQLVAWMAGGRSSAAPIALAPHQPGEVVLQVLDLTVSALAGACGLATVSFAVRAGEIVGIAGVDGNGQGPLCECLLGLLRPVAGQVRIGGHELSYAAGAARRLGSGIVPGDRRVEGLALELSIAENLVLAAPALAALPALFSPATLEARAAPLAARFAIRGAPVAAAARVLSGGNQQRIVLARELSADPRLLILVQPTRGLDLAATHAVHAEIAAARQRGTAVLLISSDLDEVLTLSDRVLALSRGRIGAELPRGASRLAVGRAMTGIHA